MDNVHILTYDHSQIGSEAAKAAYFYRKDSALNTTALTQQLQRSLDLVTLLDTFAQFIAPYAKFSGLQLHSSLGVNEMTKTHSANVANRFDIEVEGEHLGQLVYLSNVAFTNKLSAQLKQWHKILAYPLRNALTYNRVLRLATRDPLTGLNNRSDFNVNMDKKLEACRRKHRPFSLMLLDLDHFKQVNDNFGHQAGDETLQEFAAILRICLRGTDTAFRFGGDEFAVLIDDKQFETNVVIAKRIINAVKNSAIMSQYGVTCSIGFTLARAKDTNMELFERADKALYQAKFNGRDSYQGALLETLSVRDLNTHKDSQKPVKNAKIS
ncbi:GGDEF domain-containing protein [Pseudoalteromonas sp. SSDWG2]|uniref:GGDEF domain-containing protein n=1 Tax=Pseudoalteromonas sp. SSDWG2 TaxID=3139391 RepID=UPI003BA8A7DE